MDSYLGLNGLIIVNMREFVVTLQVLVNCYSVKAYKQKDKNCNNEGKLEF